MSSFNGSRFANPNRTDVLDLGPCRCVGTPHERDQYVHRVEIGSGELARAGDYGWASSGWTSFLPSETKNRLAEIAGVRWNLLDETVDGEGNRQPVVDDDGKPKTVPLTAHAVSLLDDETRDLIIARLDSLTEQPENKPLPKAPRAPSRRSSRANGSGTRKTRTRR